MTALCTTFDAKNFNPCDKKKFFNSKELDTIYALEEREQPPIGNPNASCTTNLFFGFFFDGTGNNYSECLNQPDKKEGFSNVARLYDAYPGRSVPGVLPSDTNWTHEASQYPHFFRTYIPGVGTAFNKIGDAGGTAGLAFARYGQRRILWALLQVLNNVHRFFTGTDAESGMLFSHERAAALDSMIELGWVDLTKESWGKQRHKSYAPNSSARDALRALLQQLHQVVKPHMALNGGKPAKTDPGIVNTIYISAFGFSRGAAEARAFANWLLLMCQLDAELCGSLAGHSLAGFTVEFDFLGLFDTVASVGLPSSTVLADGHAGWADASHCLRISPAINQCLHLVAAHDIRRSFPLDSTHIDSGGSVVEIIYPGAHSDLGGGYLPTEQGRGSDPKGTDMLSRVPLANMYRAARLAGVPLKAELMKAQIQDRYLVDPQLISAFNAYLADCKETSGQYKTILIDQYWPYLAWRLSCSAEQGHAALRQRFPGASTPDLNDLVAAQQWFADELSTYRKWLEWNQPEDPEPAYGREGSNSRRYAIPSFDPDHERHWRELQPLLQPIISSASPSESAKASPYYRASANSLFEHYVHDSFAGFRPSGKDLSEIRTMLNKLVAAQAAGESLTATEHAWANLYREQGKIPEMKVDGNEPFWVGAGYFRYRKVYDGASNRTLTQNRKTQPDVVLPA